MWPAFPTSDYYGPSAPPRRHQPTADLSAHARNGRNGQHRGGSHVHHVSIDGVGAQLFPLQHRHEYAADLPRGLATDCIRSASEPPPAIMSGVRCAPAHIHQVGAGVTLEGVQPLVHCPLHLSVSLSERWAIWWYRPASPLSGPLPPSPALPGSGCPQLRPGRCDDPAAEPFHLRSISWRLVAHNAVLTRTSRHSRSAHAPKTSCSRETPAQAVIAARGSPPSRAKTHLSPLPEVVKRPSRRERFATKPVSAQAVFDDCSTQKVGDVAPLADRAT
jgi:hypothetical protein